jgi:anti-sigma factor RsiW
MTTPASDVRPDCPNPLDATVLVDYWLALLPAGDEQEVEEHLMACDRCGDRLREVIELSDRLRRLARSGSLRVVVSDRLLERAEETGQRVRKYTAPAGATVQCTVTADDDLLVARLAADLSGAKRVDLRFCDAQGVERHRMTDIPIRGEAGGVVYQESIDFAKASPTTTMLMRLVAVDAEGSEKLLGEYAFHHTRTLPGPGEYRF